MRGQRSLWIIDDLPRPRQPRTALAILRRPRRAGTPSTSAACETNVTDVDATAPPNDPNIGRYRTGCGVGMDALGSPIAAVAIKPPFHTSSDLTTKKAGFPT